MLKNCLLIVIHSIKFDIIIIITDIIGFDIFEVLIIFVNFNTINNNFIGQFLNDFYIKPSLQWMYKLLPRFFKNVLNVLPIRGRSVITD